MTIPDEADIDTTRRIDRWAAANLDYWFFIGLALVSFWLSVSAEDSARLNYLFGATFFVVHAHGCRILVAVKKATK